MHDMSAIALQIVQSVYFFVEPAFKPKSEIRKRWVTGQATLRDIILFTAAGGVITAVVLIAILGLRVIIVGLQIFQGFWNVFCILIGF